jgi:hypothetical protein
MARQQDFGSPIMWRWANGNTRRRSLLSTDAGDLKPVGIELFYPQ